jgi:hypothetical protein
VGDRRTNMDIDWKCEGCGKSIEKGYIAVNTKDEVEAGKARRQWDKDHTNEHGWVICNGNDLLTYPHAAHWHISCNDCDLANDICYYIEISRINTETKVINWTAHLMEKNWIGDTDWRNLLSNLGSLVSL